MTTTSTNRVIHIGTLKNIRQFGCSVGADAVVGEAQAIAGVKGEYLKAAFDAVKKNTVPWRTTFAINWVFLMKCCTS